MYRLLHNQPSLLVAKGLFGRWTIRAGGKLFRIRRQTGEIFGEVKRVLKYTGSCWIVIADSYDKNKNMIGIPERLCINMIDRGKWTLRSKIVWWKRNATPSSAKDRFTPDWEYVLFFVKSANKYYFKTQYEPHNPNTSLDTSRRLVEPITKVARVLLTIVNLVSLRQTLTEEFSDQYGTSRLNHTKARTLQYILVN